MGQYDLLCKIAVEKEWSKAHLGVPLVKSRTIMQQLRILPQLIIAEVKQLIKGV
jgi:hypothetical protein